MEEPVQRLIGDNAYDSDPLDRELAETGVETIAPHRCNRTNLRWGLGITPAVMKRCHWVKPVLVARVKFTEWTHDDQLRQPVFLGLRDFAN